MVERRRLAVLTQYRDVPGFIGYRVGDDGSVWTLWVNPGCKQVGYMGSEWRPLQISTRPNDNYRVVGLRRCLNGSDLSDGWKFVTRLVHVLVLESFVGPRPVAYDACHNNGNPSDCRLINLRWDTRKGNMRDATKHGRTLRGSRNPNCKLSDLQVKLVRSMRQTGMTQQQVADSVGVSFQLISKIDRGLAWGWLEN